MEQIQDVVKAYRDTARSISTRVRNSKFKSQWFMNGIGLGKSPSAYYRRMKTGDWTPAQLIKFAYLLEGKAAPTELTEAV